MLEHTCNSSTQEAKARFQQQDQKKIQNKKSVGCMAQKAVCLPSILEALDPISTTTKKRKLSECRTHCKTTGRSISRYHCYGK
jgi:hypothetical protein